MGIYYVWLYDENGGDLLEGGPYHTLRVATHHAETWVDAACDPDSGCAASVHGVEGLPVHTVRQECLGWWAVGDGGTPVFLPGDLTAEEAAALYWSDGGSVEKSCAASVALWKGWDGCGSRVEECSVVTVSHPEEPACGPHGCGDHDYRAPYALVGGCESNPGVWGRGGCAIAQTVVCVRCGLRRTEVSASRGQNLEHDHETLAFEDASEEQRDELTAWWVDREERPDIDAAVYDDVADGGDA